MAVFSQIDTMGHEEVIFYRDDSSGLKAIVAIHDTTLGPALGGTRILPYENEMEALNDVLRLSRGMTYKAACAGLPLGGGKAVIIASPEQKSEALFRAYGRFVDSLHGRYITAEDMNTSVDNMDTIRLETRYVTGVSPALGGSGNPSGLTALGSVYGIEAAVRYRLGKENLSGVKIALQGVGSVGQIMCEMLHERGAKLYIQDINEKNLASMKAKFNAQVVSEAELYQLDVDVYAPCARGATLNDTTIKQLKAKVIAGCANNQLEDESKHAEMLKKAHILYAPDYVVNAGGLINVSNELIGYRKEKVLHEVAQIATTLNSIFTESDKRDITTQESAKRYAENRIRSIRELKQLNTVKSSFLGRIHSPS